MGTGATLGSLGAQSGVLEASQDRMMKQATFNPATSDDAKIEKGSKEFEAILLGSWLRQAEQSFASLPGGDDDQDPGRDQVMGLGVQTLATALSNSGGIGIAKMIAQAMHADADKERAHAASPTAPVESKKIHEKVAGLS